jgi:predicted phage terminase large subunit-like protein
VNAARELLAIEAERARRRELDRCIGSLYAFVRAMWSAAEPGRPYLDNWHVRVVCEALEAVERGDVTSLVLCQPPRTMKSYLVNVFFPAWLWLRHPEYQFLCVSNSDDLSVRDSMRMRRVVTSEGYRDLVARQAQRGAAPMWSMSKEQASKVNFLNDRGGGRECLGIRATVTGKGCDYLLLDDLYDAKEALLGDPARVAERMAEAVATHDGVLLSRFNPGGPKRKICIMQRLHEADIAGELIRRGEPSLVLPMEYDPAAADPRDQRTEPGELLVPELWLPQPLAAWKVALGSQASGQLQQRPQAATGGVLPREHWRYVDIRHMPKDEDLDVLWQAWDLAFGGKATSDFCVGVAVGLLGPVVYVVDREKGRWDFPEQLQAIRRLSERHPAAFGIAIEDAANGRAARETIQRGLDGDPAVPGIVLVRAKEDKVARAQGWSPILESGCMVAPCLCGRADIHEHGPTERHLVVPWAEDLIITCAAFPKGANDDDVDALGHGVGRVLRGGRIAAA